MKRRVLMRIKYKTRGPSRVPTNAYECDDSPALHLALRTLSVKQDHRGFGTLSVLVVNIVDQVRACSAFEMSLLNLKQQKLVDTVVIYGHVLQTKFKVRNGDAFFETANSRTHSILQALRIPRSAIKSVNVNEDTYVKHQRAWIPYEDFLRGYRRKQTAV